MQAVFNTAPKSPPVAVPTQNGVVVFEVSEVQPPAPPQFEKYRAKAESDLKAEKARNLLTSRLQELELGVMAKMNQRHLASRADDPLLTARMKSFETAFGMQTEMPEVFDFSQNGDYHPNLPSAPGV